VYGFGGTLDTPCHPHLALLAKMPLIVNKKFC
jgi:hypothetical protein